MSLAGGTPGPRAQAKCLCREVSCHLVRTARPLPWTRPLSSIASSSFLGSLHGTPSVRHTDPPLSTLSPGFHAPQGPHVLHCTLLLSPLCLPTPHPENEATHRQNHTHTRLPLWCPPDLPRNSLCPTRLSDAHVYAVCFPRSLPGRWRQALSPQTQEPMGAEDQDRASHRTGLSCPARLVPAARLSLKLTLLSRRTRELEPPIHKMPLNSTKLILWRVPAISPFVFLDFTFIFYSL